MKLQRGNILGLKVFRDLNYTSVVYIQIKKLCPPKDKQSPKSQNISFGSWEHTGMKKIGDYFYRIAYLYNQIKIVKLGIQ